MLLWDRHNTAINNLSADVIYAQIDEMISFYLVALHLLPYDDKRTHCDSAMYVDFLKANTC